MKKYNNKIYLQSIGILDLDVGLRAEWLEGLDAVGEKAPLLSYSGSGAISSRSHVARA